MPHFSSTDSNSSSIATPEAQYSGVSTPVTEYSQFNFGKEVAVVGMACRVAGNNNSPEQLWQSLLEKQDASGEIPKMRWEPYLRRDPRNARILKETTSRGYFLDHLENFDAQFFGISPKEAEQMDPQQRLSLEVTWEALENAGITAKSLSGSDTAVFWGVNSDDYSKLVLEDLPNVEAWMGIGTAYCGVPNRISYHLNLMGPSTAVDAACASSLVAVHHGVQSIVLGESKIAIVGGVNALCGPGLTRVLDKAGAVSSEGRCCSFDNDVKGYGRGEGAAAIVLKNLSSAIQDGDHIMALIKGTAVAQDGKTNGIMAPNAKAQQLVARNALKVGNVDPLTVGYVEAHATSTPLGDPTEVSAIAAVYGAEREPESPCFIGSIKPNIGHLEAGAGAMGFIKAVMAVQKGVLAPQANLTTLTKKIDWDRVGLKVVQEETKWPSTDEIRRAAICSYGYGGTVSHAVIEQFTLPETPDLTPVSSSSSPTLLLLSGPQEKRLPFQARALGEWLQSEGSHHELKRVASTLAVRRDHHDYRVGLVVDSQEDAIHALAQLASGAHQANAWTSQSRVFGRDVNKEVVWVFSGHGAQWAGMGQELLQNPVFFQAIQPLDDIVQAETNLSPIALLQTGEFEASDHVQILTYVMQIGIAAILHSHGVYPQAIIGHSVGEIAASVVAGALTAEEGAVLITRRSVLYRQVMGQGAMILVHKPYAEMADELAGAENLVVAIDSSPSSCVVAGSTAAVAQKAAELKQRSIQTFTVRTDIPFHSPMLNPLVVPLLHSLDGRLAPTAPTHAKLYSTSLADPRGQDLRDATYWANNMINPVHLTSAVQAALADSYRIFLEVSSHPLVSHSVNETIMAAGLEDFCMVPTLVRKKPSEKCILHAIAQLHSRGATVDWKSHCSGPWAGGLPNTHWMHKPTWRQVGAGNVHEPSQQTHDVEKHALLGQRIGVAGTDTVVYTTRLDNDSKPFPGSHPLHGTEIVPAAGLVNTFIKATGANALHDVALRVPIAINAPRSVQVVTQRDEVKIMSRLIPENQSAIDDSSWVTHTTARWNSMPTLTTSKAHINTQAVKDRIGTRLRDDFSIDYLAKVGVSAMGFPWAITEHYGNTEEMIARVDVAPAVAADGDLPWDTSSWAPILDAATSVGSTIFFDQPRLRMPAQIERVEIFTRENPPKTGWLYVQEASDSALASHVSVCDEAGNVVAKFTSMRFAEIEGAPGVSGSMESLVHQMAWPPAVPVEVPLPIHQIVLVSEDKALREEYAGTISTPTQIFQLSNASDLALQRDILPLNHKETAIVYIPSQVPSLQNVPEAAEAFTWQLLEIVKFVINHTLPAKVFVVTSNTAEGATPTALAQAPLVGLSRVIASEHGDQFGGLIDTEVPTFPLATMRYIQGADIIRIRDGMARTMRLRPLPRHLLLPTDTGSPSPAPLLPRPDGTYLITGGLGALGLEVADFLVSKGAQRVILLSRRDLPPRRAWSALPSDDALAPAIAKIQVLESRGASIHVLALDISVPNAAQRLTGALDQLGLPPVRGVVHAAGVLDNELAVQTTPGAFSRVLAPKVTGGLVLNEVFPASTVDFFVLFSSCGQLVGFTGQSSYAAGNAFLDTLATHRRQQGDHHAVAIQWTSWRGLGMGASTDFINAELESKGITDVSADEAFAAWLHLAKYDVDHAVILRSLAFDADEPLPTPVLTDIALRRAPSVPSSAGTTITDGSHSVVTNSDRAKMPPVGPARKAFLDEAIRSCVAVVLHLATDEVDSKAALADLGIDSVMTVTLRRHLQQALKIKVPPTLTWSHPTVSHLVGWFAEKLESTE
ncbi:6-methylsalicylic acid synthase [Penicillium cinerascens]|uniref:6-methylsalicylic acid synthase n=1 Tax=Penicillium cinerascens TaxID=70096 RepID=A0A9W9N8R3_9EURO|nr:6-methylsalicylic acid synthase [Penicillium cinerascens]KAJ5215365.1 6-methylsalicylic acid synthase [Penicillium cinerascens]